MLDPDPIVETVWIDAPPELVFAFFTDARRLARWLGERADVDAVPGGRFHVDIGRRRVRGEYVHVEPPTRVVFSWGDLGSAELPPGSSRVEVIMVSRDGGTAVTLSHHGLAVEPRADHVRGWPHKLGRLAEQS